jgi:hypothetical protein
MQYYSDKTNNMLDPVYGKVNQYIDKIPFVGNSSSKCGSAYDPVCANNITYSNPCLAGLAGITQVTAGACI